MGRTQTNLNIGFLHLLILVTGQKTTLKTSRVGSDGGVKRGVVDAGSSWLSSAAELAALSAASINC